VPVNSKNIVVIAGASEFERYWEGRFREIVRLRRENLNFVEFVGLPAPQVLDRVSALPTHTVIFAMIASQDSADSVLKVFDLIAAIGQRFPTYDPYDYCIGHGCVGGSSADEAQDGRRAGEIAARVLLGEKPESIPVERGANARPVVDWRQLRYWNIPESELPLGTVVLYRPPPFWQRYKWQLEIALMVFVGLIFLCGCLFFERMRRKRAEESVARQLQFETLISKISSVLTNTPSRQIGSGIQKSLVPLRDFLGVDRVSLFRMDDAEECLRLRYSAGVEGSGSAPEVLRRAEYPWLFALLGAPEPVVISGPDDLPNEANAERALFREINLRTVVIFSLNVENCLVGILTFVVIQSGRSWSKDLLPQLTSLSQVYANAFARELAQEALAESESRFRVMGDAAPAFIWMSDPDGKFTYVNKKALDFVGAKAEDLNGNGWFGYLHPDDTAATLEARRQALKEHERYVREYRVRRHDGVYRSMLDIGNPRYSAEGAFVGFIGSAVDVTDQHLAQEALEKVSGQLIAAQEKERSNIARELHDDICQRLAMLSLRIEKVTKGWNSGHMSVGDQLEQIWQQCSDLTGDVQALSHELHPSILDNLGLVTAVKSFCRELSEEGHLVVEFSHSNIPSSLPREISLSLFRVIQEALHNSAKYSGEKRFEVRLEGKSGEIELEVSDRGVGFDVASVRSNEGLGLVSMAERIHLLSGTITIESKANAGTRIHARVPVTTRPIARSALAN